MFCTLAFAEVLLICTYDYNSCAKGKQFLEIKRKFPECLLAIVLLIAYAVYI